MSLGNVQQATRGSIRRAHALLPGAHGGTLTLSKSASACCDRSSRWRICRMRAASGAAGRFRKALKDGGGMRMPVSRAPASHRAITSLPTAAAARAWLREILRMRLCRMKAEVWLRRTSALHRAASNQAAG